MTVNELINRLNELKEIGAGDFPIFFHYGTEDIPVKCATGWFINSPEDAQIGFNEQITLWDF